ncbi:hypothetical protein Ae201684P_009042 [Aphanomyces euteiches]|nr:hypothetical protein Ae201684P_009042 [Aphanomyces euteiches]
MARAPSRHGTASASPAAIAGPDTGQYSCSLGKGARRLEPPQPSAKVYSCADAGRLFVSLDSRKSSETFKHCCRLLCVVIVVGCFHVVLKSAPWNAFPSIIDPVDKVSARRWHSFPTLSSIKAMFDPTDISWLTHPGKGRWYFLKDDIAKFSALNDISCEMCAEVIPEQMYGLQRLVLSMPKMIREGCLSWSSSISLQTCFPNPFRTRKRGYRLPLVSAKTIAVIRSFSLPAHFIQTDLVPDLLHVCFDFVNVKFRHN